MAQANDDAPVRAGTVAAIEGFARTAWARRIGLLIGVLLLGLALFIVARQHQAFSDAWASIHQRSPARLAWQLAIVAGTIVGNIVLTAALFNLLIARYGKVGIIEMQALIAASTLINYVPLRPGFFGRVAYHKTFNNIAIAHSTKVVLQGIAISVIVSFFLAAAVLVQRAWGIELGIITIAAFGLLVLVGGVLKPWRTWCWAASIRFAEVIVIAVRYFIVFDLIGAPIGATESVAFACISTIATMVPFLSNGLGLREWAVGIAAPLLIGCQMEMGITADLVIRALELLVIAVAGCAGLAWLTKRHLKHNWIS
jgi:hypothetical protein